ncbi:MAG: HNH endonuclease signature motif containing protein [Candidatus Aenigmarchaeota archaeon]|nr:HNH endonuclease signature motif containing protein [Candidatus Aenigmarchaeota archaeon]
MDDFNFLGTPSKKKSKKEQNIFDFGPAPKKEVERDTRRAFSQTQRKEILYQQDNKCAKCHKKLDPRDIEFDHKKPWASVGRTVIDNGRALCGSCHKIVTHETKLKEVDKKRKSKTKDDNLFGGNFKPLPKRSKNDPLGF